MPLNGIVGWAREKNFFLWRKFFRRKYSPEKILVNFSPETFLRTKILKFFRRNFCPEKKISEIFCVENFQTKLSKSYLHDIKNSPKFDIIVKNLHKFDYF